LRLARLGQTSDDVHLFRRLALAQKLVEGLDRASLDTAERVEFEDAPQGVNNP
jgi:hypothetical protein